MTDLSEMLADVLDVLQDMGTTGTLTAVVGAYDPDGTVTETLTTYAVTVSPIIDENAVYDSPNTLKRVRGTVYVAASGLAVAPLPGYRLTHGGRTFTVHAVQTFSIEDGACAYALQVEEVGS